MRDFPRIIYQGLVPASVRGPIWSMRQTTRASLRRALVRMPQPAQTAITRIIPAITPDVPPPPPPPLPTVVGLLNKGFGITPERHAEWARNTPTVALHMSQNCSHGCVYCVSGMFDNTKRSGYLEAVGWETYGRQLLKLAGKVKVAFNFAGPGECAEHPDFIPLVRLLLDAGHFVYIQTHGLSSRTIARALEPYSRDFIMERVTLHLSFHVAAYLDDKDTRRLDAYVQKHLPRLAKLGCLICLIVPLSPRVLLWSRTEELLTQFKQTAESLGVRGFIFALTEFHGPYQGREFPAEYSSIERRRLSELLTKFGNPSRGEMDGDSAVAVGDGLLVRGLPCYAHVMISEVLPDGSLRHCQSWPVDAAGHLRDEQLDQTFQARPCPYQKCICVSVGVNMTLKPNGITLQDYANELQIVTAASERSPADQACTHGGK
jgi:MoaA/NifB/PqqE/SkfB family radical SAM enzyme